MTRDEALAKLDAVVAEKDTMKSRHKNECRLMWEKFEAARITFIEACEAEKRNES